MSAINAVLCIALKTRNSREINAQFRTESTPRHYVIEAAYVCKGSQNARYISRCIIEVQMGIVAHAFRESERELTE